VLCPPASTVMRRKLSPRPKSRMVFMFLDSARADVRNLPVAADMCCILAATNIRGLFGRSGSCGLRMSKSGIWCRFHTSGIRRNIRAGSDELAMIFR
jgi:hypothetical protein